MLEKCEDGEGNEVPGYERNTERPEITNSAIIAERNSGSP